MMRMIKGPKHRLLALNLIVLAVMMSACSNPAPAALLDVSQTSLNLGLSDTGTLTVTNAGEAGSVLDWSVEISYDDDDDEGTGWLMVEPASGSTPSGAFTTLDLAVNRDGLAPGDYSATLNVTSNGGNASVTVSLRVLIDSSPKLRLSTTGVDFGSSDTARTLTVTNAGDAGSALNWSLDISYEGAEGEAGWLSVDPMSEITLVNTLSTVTLTARRDGLAPGDYRATLSVRSNGGNDSVGVLLRVPDETSAGPRPALMLSTGELDFGSGISSGAVALSNTGDAGSELEWSVDISYNDEGGTGWLMVEPMSGSTSSGAVTTLDLAVNRDGLAPGDYSATLSITSNGGNASVQVLQSVTEGSEPGTPPALGVSSDRVNFGSSDRARTLTITNTGAAGSTLTWSFDLAYEGAGGWLDVSPASGSTPAEGVSTVTLTANRDGLAPGDYRAVLTLTSNGGDASVTVRLRVPDGQTPGGLDYSVSPETLEFGATETSQTFLISNNHSAAIAWTAAADAPWLSIINPSSEERGQPLEPGRSDTVQVRVERGVLTPGSHQATVTVTAADSADPSLSGVRTIGVTVQVADAGTPGLSISGQLTTANAAISLSQQEAPEDSAALTASSTAGRARYVPGQLLVRYEDVGDHGLYQQTARTLEAEYGLRTLRAAEPGAPELVVAQRGEDIVALAAKLSRDPRILYAEPNYYLYTQDVSTQALPNDSRIAEQWALAASGLPVGWRAEAGATNPVVVAVIDSGFDLNHEDLAPRFLPGYDFCGDNDCALTDDDPGFGDSDNLHGTHVAGIIGAIGNNGVGVAGVAHGPGLRLLPVKVFDGDAATLSSLIDSIRWSVGMRVTTSDGVTLTNPNPARILNLSLGGDFSSMSLQDALDDARERGALVVAATGNDGFERVLSPAAADGVIGVGAHNRAFARACFSNYGTGPNGPGGVDIVAPGGDGSVSGICQAPSQSVLSTLPDDGYGLAAGTSMATPMVAGVAALLLSQNPALTVAQLERALLDTAYFDPETMSALEYGAGVLRADRALGLPGPGDSIMVRAEGPATSQTSAVLNLEGGSSAYLLDSLAPGAYTLTAGSRGSLFGQRTVTLSEGSSLSGQDIELDYLP